MGVQQGTAQGALPDALPDPLRDPTATGWELLTLAIDADGLGRGIESSDARLHPDDVERVHQP